MACGGFEMCGFGSGPMKCIGCHKLMDDAEATKCNFCGPAETGIRCVKARCKECTIFVEKFWNKTLPGKVIPGCEIIVQVKIRAMIYCRPEGGVLDRQTFEYWSFPLMSSFPPTLLSRKCGLEFRFAQMIEIEPNPWPVPECKCSPDQEKKCYSTYQAYGTTVHLVPIMSTIFSQLEPMER